jgi:hypothetical protein
MPKRSRRCKHDDSIADAAGIVINVDVDIIIMGCVDG